MQWSSDSHFERIPLELLCFLVERSGEIVSREAILERIWGKGVFLDAENSINTAVRKVRRALKDNAITPRFLATVPTRGYRFVSKPQSAIDTPRLYSPSTALVGRRRELANLGAAAKRTRSGKGEMFFVSGEPGIGKTRLTEETAILALEKGMRVLIGHCLDHDQAVPTCPSLKC